MLRFLPILLLFFSVEIFAFQELPRVYTEPSLGIAEYERKDKAFKIVVKFWNVGQIYDREHGAAKIEVAGSECATGTFEGGPNGKFHFISNCDSGNPNVGRDFPLTFQMIDGKRIPATGLLSGDKYFTVTNPQIFANWSEDEKVPADKLNEVRVGWEEGEFQGFDGEVWIKENENSEWKRATAGTVIKPGCRIKTGEESTAKIRFPRVEKGESILGPKTEIVIHKPENKTWWTIIGGRIWNNIKKMYKDGTMEIEDTFQAGGIKGTIFVVEEINGRSVIKVIEGAVEVKPKNGKPEMLTAGKSMISQNTRTGSVIDFDINSETKYWDSLNTKLATASPTDLSKIFLIIGISGFALFFVLLLILTIVLILRKSKA